MKTINSVEMAVHFRQDIGKRRNSLSSSWRTRIGLKTGSKQAEQMESSHLIAKKCHLVIYWIRTDQAYRVMNNSATLINWEVTVDNWRIRMCSAATRQHPWWLTLKVKESANNNRTTDKINWMRKLEEDRRVTRHLLKGRNTSKCQVKTKIGNSRSVTSLPRMSTFRSMFSLTRRLTSIMLWNSLCKLSYL